MKKDRFINKISLLEIRNGDTATKLSMQDCFEKILINFSRTQKDVYVLLETIILSCVLIEAIIKEKLRRINPTLTLETIDSTSIAVVTNKTKKLRKELQKDRYDIKSAQINVLMMRFLDFYHTDKSQNELTEIFTVRNKIIHSVKGYSVDEKRIAIILTKTVFPFIYEHIFVSENLWNKVLRIQRVAHDNYKISLTRKINDYEKNASILSVEQISSRLLQKPLPIKENEWYEYTNLPCPACHEKAVIFVCGVDFEGGQEGPQQYSYGYTKCRVCNLKLNSTEYRQIMEDANAYFNEQEIDTWRIALSNINWYDYDI